MGTVHAKEMGSSEDEPHAKEVILGEVPAKVQKIHIEGLGRTKDDLVAKQVKTLFAADNFEDVVRTAETVRQQMQEMGLFRRVKVSIDTAKGENARADGYEVTYSVKETRRMAGGINTLVGTNDGSVMFQLRLPNMFGRAELLSGEYTHGTKSTIGYGLNFRKPLAGNPNINLQGGVYQFKGEYPWSGYKQTDRGVNTELNFPSIFGQHNVRWEGVWRDLNCLNNTTSFSVREQAGHSLKSSVQHVWTRDQRDDKVIPNKGYYVKVTQELAGLGGDTQFVKHDMEFQLNKTLLLDSVVQLSLAGGIMKSLDAGKDIKLVDRFYLGGPLTLRGYNFKGIGPHDAGSALGADSYWLAGLHLYTPLPFRPGKGGFGELFRTHFFLNAGNLYNFDFHNFGGNWKESVQKLAEHMRWSYGAGIVLKMGGIARLELNYCWPMWAQRGDSINPGLQFGIGINFL